MAFGLGRGLSTPLMVINFILYLIAAALAGWALNRNINAGAGKFEGPLGTSLWNSDHLKATMADCIVVYYCSLKVSWRSAMPYVGCKDSGACTHGHVVAVVLVAGNAATLWFLPMALTASVVGLASVLTGTHHLRVWRNDSLAAASAASLIAWMLTLLAMG